jgi:hypothetical protein
VYEIVLQEGTPADILTYVDGVLLVDLWEDLVLPRNVRSAWAPLISLSGDTVAQWPIYRSRVQQRQSCRPG